MIVTKLAIIDLGTVVDQSERSGKGLAAKEAYLTPIYQAGRSVGRPESLEAQRREWAEIYDPRNVHTDTLYAGVIDQLESLNMSFGYQILLLSAEPEALRQATQERLREQGIVIASLGTEIPGYDWLLMQATAFVKHERQGEGMFAFAPIWTAGTIESLTALLQPTDLLYISQHEEYRSAVETADLALPTEGNLYLAASLEDAITKLAARRIR